MSLNISANEWEINNDHSELLFSVSFLRVSQVNGRFNDLEGLFVLDKANDRPTQIIIKTKVNSIFTGNSKRDTHLKSGDFFNAKIYPTIEFKSKSITSLGDSSFEASGTIKIKGQIYPLQVTLKLSKMIKDTWGHENIFVSFKSNLDRRKINLDWNKTISGSKYLVGNQVQISGQFQLQPSSKKTPTIKYLIPDTDYIRLREKLGRGEISLKDIPQQYKTTIIEEVPKKESRTNRNSSTELIPTNSESKTWTWWIAYSTMGFIGFVGIIIISFQCKEWYSNKIKAEYQESGVHGILSDLMIYPLICLYAWSLYYIGFIGS